MEYNIHEFNKEHDVEQRKRTNDRTAAHLCRLRVHAPSVLSLQQGGA